MQEKFKVENVENVSEIMESDEWIDFFKFEKIPMICQRYCSGGKLKEVVYE